MINCIIFIRILFYRKPAGELKVRLGEWDTQTLDELYQHQDRYVSKVSERFLLSKRLDNILITLYHTAHCIDLFVLKKFIHSNIDSHT